MLYKKPGEMSYIYFELANLPYSRFTMRKFNLYAFIIILAAFFVLLLYKAIKLPVVTDESITAVNFIQYSLWDIIMYTNHYPNNHILNTLLTKLLVNFFGNEQIIIRLPNILFFLVYGIGIFRINKAMLKADSIFFIPAALLFMANPYLLDFFGLCRGYGMSSALITLSISYLVTAYLHANNRHAWAALILAMLAAYANFTVLTGWVAVTMLVLFYFFVTGKHVWQEIVKQWGMIAFITVFYVALIANPVIKMNRAGEFQYWTSNGFYKETLLPVIDFSRSNSNLIPDTHTLTWLVFLVIVFNLGYIGVRLIRSHFDLSVVKQPVFTTTIVLLMTVFINLLQCWLLKTPNLHGRTALFFYPMFIAVAVSFAGIVLPLRHKVLNSMLAMAIAFICVFHVADRFRINWVRDAWQSVNTFEVLNYLRSDSDTEPVTFEAYYYLYHSFNYYVFTGKVPWLKLEDYDESVDMHTRAEYYYIFEEDYQMLEPTFDVVQHFGENRLLLKRKEQQHALRTENK